MFALGFFLEFQSVGIQQKRDIYIYILCNRKCMTVYDGVRRLVVEVNVFYCITILVVYISLHNYSFTIDA